MIPPLETAQFNIYKSHQFISDKGTIGKEGEWDGWNYGIDAPNSNIRHRPWDLTLESASPSPPQGSIWHRFNIDSTLIRNRFPICQGRILAVWILAPKRPNPDLKIAVDFWVDFILLFFPWKKARKIHQKILRKLHLRLCSDKFPSDFCRSLSLTI